MPSPAFTLSVPADEPFRGLVADAVRAFLRVSDQVVSPAAEAFVASVDRAAERLAGRGADVEMVVLTNPPRVDVELTCGGAVETLTHTGS